MGKKRLTLSDQIRRAVDDSGLSRYRICKVLGIAQSTMSEFMSGKSGLSLERLDALADLLDVNITKGKRQPKRKGK
jgi:transcriptional regulator with XRE-family HTH domain